MEIGQRYDVNGRQLWLHRSGTGTPSVVFVPGGGLVGLDYLQVSSRVAERSTSVIYDRAGTGWSDAVPLPRSAADVAGELRALLSVANVPAPYVLVGHSIGALYARRFAQLWPESVVGLVLLDPGHEDLFAYLPPGAAELSERMRSELPEPTAEQLEAARPALAGLYAAWPESVRTALVDHHLTSWRTGLEETANMETELYGELRAGGVTPDVPMIVLTAMGQNPFWSAFATPEEQQAAQNGIRRLHADLAASVSKGEQRLLDGATHQYLHIEQPDAVVAAIGDVVESSDVEPASKQ